MKNVLLVEDDTILGEAIVEAFQGSGYQLFWAKNNSEVWEILKNQTIDLIYLDIMLPEVGGYEILQKLRADLAYQKLPVVMLTNLGQMSEINKAMELGATDYIVKANIDLSKLVEITGTKYLGLGSHYEA